MRTILIIDDDPSNRDILRARLEAAGYAVREALNGEEGIAAALADRPDAVVLDVMMPKVDGWQVCKRLKTEPATSGVPVVMLTARSQQIEELRGWESGADEYLAKPCDHKRLLETIERLLARPAGGKP